MFTGYFSKIGSYKNVGLEPVSISVKSPTFFVGKSYKILAPSEFLLKEFKYGSHKYDTEFYTKTFEGYLNSLSFSKVLSDLTNLVDVSLDKVVLLCYEKPSSFCHRHLVAAWFINHGIICKEFQEEISLF